MQTRCKMVQKEEYIDYQEVNPSPLHFEKVQLGCNHGAKRGAELATVPFIERVVVKVSSPRFRRNVARNIRPVARFSGAVLLVLGSVGTMGYLVYRAALFVRYLAVSAYTWLVESNVLFYLGVGFVACIVIYLFWSMQSQIKNSVKFDDLNKKEEVKTGGVVINHHYHIGK